MLLNKKFNLKILNDLPKVKRLEFYTQLAQYFKTASLMPTTELSLSSQRARLLFDILFDNEMSQEVEEYFSSLRDYFLQAAQLTVNQLSLEDHVVDSFVKKLIARLGCILLLSKSSDSSDFYSMAKSSFCNKANDQNIQYLVRLTSYVTNDFKRLVSDFSVLESRSCLEVISFLFIEKNYFTEHIPPTSLSEQSRADALHVENAKTEKLDYHEALFRLVDYLTELVQVSCGVKFDEYFIMRNKLVGYEFLLEKSMFSKSPQELKVEDVEVLVLVRSHLVDVGRIYFVLRVIESRSQSSIQIDAELKELFWSLFDQIPLADKIRLICKIYCNEEISLDKDNSVKCLIESSFGHRLTTSINQISGENCDDAEVS